MLLNDEFGMIVFCSGILINIGISIGDLPFLFDSKGESNIDGLEEEGLPAKICSGLRYHGRHCNRNDIALLVSCCSA